MGNDFLTDQGTLKNEFKPAAYLDSSILIDYFLTYEEPPLREKTEEEELQDEMYEAEVEYRRSLFHRDPRLILKDLFNDLKFFDLGKKENDWRNVLIKCRELVLNSKLKINLIYTPFSFIELSSWYTEDRFKNFLATFYPIKKIQKMGLKDISIKLKGILDKVREDTKLKNKHFKHDEIPDSLVLLKQLVFGAYLWPKKTDPEFDKHPDDPEYIPYPSEEPDPLRAFNGLFPVDVINYNLSLFPFKEFINLYGSFAYLNIGLADILHILLAKHLECKYLVSKDVDFLRCFDDAKTKLGIEIIGDPQKFLKIILK